MIDRIQYLKLNFKPVPTMTRILTIALSLASLVLVSCQSMCPTKKSCCSKDGASCCSKKEKCATDKCGTDKCTKAKP